MAGPALAGALLMPVAAMAGELELLMFERDGCSYCRRWHEEIGPAYPRTAEGAAAPLRPLDITDKLPEGVTLTGRWPAFTPTFVLLDDGTEAGRIEGYAGDEFFWVLLAGMMKKTGWTPGMAPAQEPAVAPAASDMAGAPADALAVDAPDADAAPAQ